MGPRLTTILGILTMMGGRHPKEVGMRGGRCAPLAVATTAATAINAVEERAPSALAAGVDVASSSSARRDSKQTLCTTVLGP
jgi:hypothetical protein